MIDPNRVFADPKVVELARTVGEGNLEKTRQLLKGGVNAKLVGQKGFTVTHFALYAPENGPAVLKLILDAGADPISSLEDGKDVPYYAVGRDNADPAIVTVLLNAGVSPSRVGGPTRDSLLSYAVSGNNESVVTLLIDRGADVNFNHPFAGTALHHAMTGPRYKIAALLLDRGADPRLRDSQDPSIGPDVPRMTPGEIYCSTESGKRSNPTPDQWAGWVAMRDAFARHGAPLPCGI